MFIGRAEADYVALKCSTRLSNIDFSDWRNITSTATFYMEYAIYRTNKELVVKKTAADLVQFDLRVAAPESDLDENTIEVVVEPPNELPGAVDTLSRGMAQIAVWNGTSGRSYKARIGAATF